MKIICPNPSHLEKTASFHVYPDGYGHCFGCGFHAKFKEGVTEDLLGIESLNEKPIEDIKYSINHINSLEKKIIRGVELPFDDKGYYLVWPCNSYYKIRMWDTSTKGGKYKGASGVAKPWYKHIKGSDTLIIVEGELNALSIAVSAPKYDVISPGGAGDFYSATAKKEIPLLYTYKKVLVICDEDAAGAKAAIEVKSLLFRNGHDNVSIRLWSIDANSILENYGKEELTRRITKELEMPS